MPAPPELRQYQRDCVDQLRASFGTGHRAPLLQLATGGGKTLIFGEITAGAARKGNPVLIVAHRRELVRQASDKLDWAGVPHGIIAAGLDADPSAPVQVASIQTLNRRLDTLPQFGLIVFDEAHHCRAETWRALLAYQPAAKLLGVTATAARLDGKGLGTQAGGCFDDLVLGPSTSQLITDGWLSPVRCFVPPQRIDRSRLRVVAGEYVRDQVAAVMDDAVITGDAIEHYRRHADHQAAIAFCSRVDHAEHVAAAFRDAGYRSHCVHGGTPKDERDALIAGLGNGAVEVLTSCDLISEGLDVPIVGAVILLRPTKSLVLHRQQIGRGMRPVPGKTALIVNDHVGNCITHGLPDIEPAWSLDGVEKPTGSAPVWECPECGCLNPLGSAICENCDYERPPAAASRKRYQQAGDLVELTPERLAALRRMSRSEIENGSFSEAELKAYAAARGFRAGWVYFRMMAQISRSPDPEAGLRAYAKAHGYHRGWVRHRLHEQQPSLLL